YRRHERSRGPDRTAAAVGITGLWLCRDHRRFRRTAASDRHPARQPADVPALPGWRGCADGPATAFRDDRTVSRHALVLPPRVRRVHQLPRQGDPPAEGPSATRGGNRMMDNLIPILVAAVAAGTPMVFAALGELITEKSGVLNLGVEGMMLMG